MAKRKADQDEPIETQMWKAADKLRKNIDAAEYKHVVLGLIFLKYISDAFEELHAKLATGEGEYAGADPEDRDEYRAENVFFVPPSARWEYLQSRAKTPEIGKDVDAAMDAIERDNPSLRGVLPKVYARGNLDPTNLGGLIDLISNIAMDDAQERSADVLGHVFEYFLGEFALAEGKKGGQFYTPKSVVKLLVEMLEPYNGRVFDPCCGSGGMFVQSEEVCDRAPGPGQRYLHLRPGEQPDHLAAGQDEPGYSGHRQLSGALEQRRLLFERRPQGPEGRLRDRQPAL